MFYQLANQVGEFISLDYQHKTEDTQESTGPLEHSTQELENPQYHMPYKEIRMNNAQANLSTMDRK